MCRAFVPLAAGTRREDIVCYEASNTWPGQKVPYAKVVDVDCSLC